MLLQFVVVVDVVVAPVVVVLVVSCFVSFRFSAEELRTSDNSSVPASVPTYQVS